MLKEQAQAMLEERLIPFWSALRDDEFGGFYGYMGFDLDLDKKAEKGCILNSRILWFFSRCASQLGREDCLKNAEHAYHFLMDHCLDREKGGVYWSLNYDGSPWIRGSIPTPSLSPSTASAPTMRLPMTGRRWTRPWPCSGS